MKYYALRVLFVFLFLITSSLFTSSLHASSLIPPPKPKILIDQEFWNSREKNWEEKGYQDGPKLFKALKKAFNAPHVHDESLGFTLPTSPEEKYSLVDFALFCLQAHQKEGSTIDSEYFYFFHSNPYLQKIQGYGDKELARRLFKFLNFLQNVKHHIEQQDTFLTLFPHLQRTIEPDFWEIQEQRWTEAGLPQGKALFHALKEGYEEMIQTATTADDLSLPASFSREEWLKHVLYVAKNASWAADLSFLNPSPYVPLHLAQQNKKARLKHFLQNVRDLETLSAQRHISFEDATRFEEWQLMWKTLPPSWMQPNDTVFSIFTTLQKHLFSEEENLILKRLPLFAERVEPMDLEAWGQWDKLFLETINPLLASRDTRNKNSEEFKSFLEPALQSLITQAFQKRLDDHQKSLEMLWKKGSSIYDDKISLLALASPIIWDSGITHKIEALEAALTLTRIYPDGTPENPYLKTAVDGKNYRLRYESIYANPYAEALERPDKLLQEYLDKLDLKDAKKTLEDLKNQLEHKFFQKDRGYIVNLFQAPFRRVCEKLHYECFSKDLNHQLLGHFVVARFLRLLDAMKTSFETPEEGEETFYMSVAQNADPTWSRCVDGINESLNEDELKYVYATTLNQDDQNLDKTGLIVARLLKDSRQASLNEALNTLYPQGVPPQGVGMEVRTYSFVNTFKALRIPFGLIGRDPDLLGYPFHHILSPTQFLKAWVYGGTLSSNVQGITRTYHLNPFTPETAAEIVKNQVGMGKPISLELFDTLISWDVVLRQAQKQWKDAILNQEEGFENAYFKGSEAPHKAMKTGGYIRILNRLGYVVETP